MRCEGAPQPCNVAKASRSNELSDTMQSGVFESSSKCKDYRGSLFCYNCTDGYLDMDRIQTLVQESAFRYLIVLTKFCSA